MTTEKLEKANELSKEMADLNRLIGNAKTQVCEWIDFTFGNGSNRANVCKDKETIQLVRDLIVKENETRLAQLKKEFSEL